VAVAAEALLARRLLPTETFYDEGVYLVSLDALRHGQELGSEVFTAQPPGWYHLLELSAAVFGNTTEGVRTGLIAVVCVGVIAAFAAGRALAGSFGGFLCAGLLVIAYPLPLFAPRVLADPSSLGLTLVALALVLWRPPRGELALAAAGGAAFAAATSVKLYAVLAAPTLVALLWRRAPAFRTLVAWTAGAGVYTAGLLVVHAGELASLWDGAVSYHRKGAGQGELENVDAILEIFNARMPFTWLVVTGVVTGVIVAARSHERRATLWLWLWPVLTLALLLWHSPLLEHHLTALAVSLVLPVGVTLAGALRGRRPQLRRALVGALALLLIAGYAQQYRRVGGEVRAEEAGIVWAAERLRRDTRPDDLVVSDLPVAAYLADRRVPGELVDTAMLRLDTGSLTRDSILKTIDRRCVQAVVVGRVFGLLPGFAEDIGARFGASRRLHGVTVYTARRSRCSRGDA
jgi:hypothetical protein